MRERLQEALTRCRHSSWRGKPRRNNQPQLGEWAGEDSFAGDYRPGRQGFRWSRVVRTPLRRWLRAQTGRPWNAVWRELSEGSAGICEDGADFREIARRYVDLHCKIDATTRRPVLVNGKAVTGLYVDPRNGLLRWLQPPSRAQWRRSQPTPSADTLRVDGSRFHIKRNGTWFEIAVTKQPHPAKGKDLSDFEWNHEHYRIVRKRSLDARSLRKAGLKNDDA